MADDAPFQVTRWNLSDGSRQVWPVHGINAASAQAAVNSLSPNAWTQTINVGWTNRPSGEGATLIGTLTSGSPSLDPIDTSRTGYLVFELAAPNATVVLLDLWANGKP